VTDGGAPSPGALDVAVRWMARVAKQDGSRIFVHCRAGQERTAAVLAAYVATHSAFTLDQAIEWLAASRYGGRPLPSQEHAVREWLAPTTLPRDAVYRSRVRGCLLGGAIGDALGAPIEFMRRPISDDEPVVGSCHCVCHCETVADDGGTMAQRGHAPRTPSPLHVR
jgi:hypothetical protein